MGKPKKTRYPRPKKKQARQPQAASRLEPQLGAKATDQKGLWERIQNHPIPWLLGLVAALAGLYGTMHDALHDPEIVAPKSSADPLELHFQIKNPSSFFAMHRMEVHCVIDKAFLVGTPNLALGNDDFRIVGLFEVDSGKSAEATCSMRKALVFAKGFPEAQNIRLHFVLSFETLFFRRTFVSEPFNWDKGSREWYMGEMLN